MPHECTNCGRVFADGSKEMLSGCPNCGGNKFQFRPASATDSDAGTTADAETTADAGGDAETPTTDPETPPTDPETSPTDPETPTVDPDASRADSDASTAWSGAADRALDDRSASSATDRSSETDRDPLASSREWPNQRDDDTSSRSPSTVDPAADRGTSEADAEATDASAGTSTADVSEPTASDDLSPDDPPEDTAQANARSDVVSPDEIAAAGPDDGTERGPEAGAAAGDDGPPTDSRGRVIEPSSDERPDLDDLREELNEQFESIKIVAPGEYELNLMELYDRTEYIISLQEDGRYVIEVPDTWDTTPDPDDS